MALAVKSLAASLPDDVSTSSRSIDLDRSSSTTAVGGNGEEREQLVWKETVAVTRSKILIFLAIILAGIAGGTTTGIIFKNEEKSDFDTQFQGWAKEIGDVSEVQAENTFSIIRSLGKSITASALSADETFPFFTMPFFEVQGGEAQEISGAEVVLFAPLVKTSDKESWENYAVANQGWVTEGLSYRGWPDIDPGPIPEQVYSYSDTHGNHKDGEIHVEGYLLPVWQMAGAPRNSSIINLDLMTRSSFEHTNFDVIEKREGILSDVCDFNYLTENSVEGKDAEAVNPQSYVLEPVFESFDKNAKVGGFVVAVFPWNNFFKNVFPDKVEGVIVVIDDKCGDIFTYEINGSDAVYLGKDDMHELAYDSQKYTIDFAAAKGFGGSHPAINGTSYTEYFENTSKGHCKYTLEVYPSAKLESRFTSNQHIAYALVVVSIFFALLILLLIYDCMVTRRQRILMSSAERTNALVSSLFPETVQKRIMDDAVQSDKVSRERTGNNMFGGDVNNESTSFTSRPIADLFPNTTVLFADIAGFTSWSSAREPAQVFVLLETIYQAFDKIAKRRRVFKVETIGDCYVAVVGLPAPRKDHAVVMARFAQDCLSTFSMLVKQMEVTLGPDTGELALRTGLHSGPVTAGVLRGEKSRFQLFGDTVNTTARIETSGVRNQIHISQETADLLKSAGKEHWIRLREDRVVAKGKGELVTYWMEPKVSQCRQSSCGGSDRDEIALESIGQDANESSTFDDATKSADTRVITSRFVEKQDNLIQWNTDMLSNLLKGIMARRHDCGIHPSDLDEIHALEHDSLSKHHSTNRMEEAEETIHLPGLATASREHSIELSEAVTSQLLSFVHTIADMYPDNPFHNFEHASHVTMSVQKLLCRIVAQSDTEAVDESHHRSYGITSDPLIHFAIVLSALIHDVDHPGVPNATLVQEKSKLAAVYKNKSIAEQNSIDLAWDLLMDDSFVDLRRALYTTTDEFLLLRKLVTKSVVATDIMDKQLGACRKARWAKAFEIKNEDTDVITGDEYQKDDHDRKATIVLEHVIQASDVAHTMQHWQIYIKWNERLFHEMYRAFLDGRSSQDPSENWYSNELGFFDFYLIPLANKLESCGCFGVSGIEYLNYVTKNRREWESNGKEAVARYLETYSVSSGL